MNDMTHDALSGNSPLHKAYVFVHSMLINDSESGKSPLLKTPAAVVLQRCNILQ